MDSDQFLTELSDSCNTITKLLPQNMPNNWIEYLIKEANDHFFNTDDDKESSISGLVACIVIIHSLQKKSNRVTLALDEIEDSVTLYSMKLCVESLIRRNFITCQSVNNTENILKDTQLIANIKPNPKITLSEVKALVGKMTEIEIKMMLNMGDDLELDIDDMEPESQTLH